MKSLRPLLVLVLPLVVAGTALAATNGTRPNAGGQKVIMDNDWSATAAGQFLMALGAGWDVLGLVGDTADSWALQTSLHALALLRLGGLAGCVPVHKGADLPLLMTPRLMAAYQALQGPLAWQGVFAPENATAEAAGADATGGSPAHLSRAAFYEGFPDGGPAGLAGTRAAAWMVDQVRRYPGEVVIYSGGALTNVALAVRLDPDFASLTKGLWVMGGFVDTNLLMTSGNTLQADINTDFNFKADPEAAKIALTADFPNITLVSNAANAYFPDQAFLDDVSAVQNPYTKLARDHTDTTLPLWDEITVQAMLDPGAILNQTTFYANIDTSFYSPTYGNVWAYQDALVPPAQGLREVNFVYATNVTAMKSALKSALQYPRTCPDSST